MANSVSAGPSVTDRVVFFGVLILFALGLAHFVFELTDKVEVYPTAVAAIPLTFVRRGFGYSTAVSVAILLAAADEAWWMPAASVAIAEAWKAYLREAGWQ